jgi:hypothetical protein
MTMKVRKAVFPAASLGTRFLAFLFARPPATVNGRVSKVLSILLAVRGFQAEPVRDKWRPPDRYRYEARSGE